MGFLTHHCWYVWMVLLYGCHVVIHWDSTFSKPKLTPGFSSPECGVVLWQAEAPQKRSAFWVGWNPLLANRLDLVSFECALPSGARFEVQLDVFLKQYRVMWSNTTVIVVVILMVPLNYRTRPLTHDLTLPFLLRCDADLLWIRSVGADFRKRWSY